MIVIANIFPRLQTVKDFVRPLRNNCRFRTSFDSQLVEASRKILKSAWEHFYHISILSAGNWFRKYLP